MKSVLIAAMLLSAAPAFAADFIKLPNPVTGEAPIENGNKQLAHDQALADAIRNAVIKGAGAQLDSATITEGGTLVQDKVFLHANGYIKSYTLDEDADQGDGTWEVRLRDVVVGTGALDKDLAAVRAEIISRGHPRLYALIREQSIENLGPSGKDKAPNLADLSQGVVQEYLVEHMRPLGWKFVDPEVASGKVHVQNALTTDLGQMDGRDFATTGADYVILGSVIVRPEKAEGMLGKDLQSVDVQAVLYVKSTDTGETVASVEKSMPASSFTEADAATKGMKKIAAELTAALQKQVLETWRHNRMGVGNLHLLVAVNDYGVLQAFEQQLQNGVANVRSVQEVSFNNGKADLSLAVAGTNTHQLAGSLSGKTVQGRQIKVTRVTENTVAVNLVQ